MASSSSIPQFQIITPNSPELEQSPLYPTRLFLAGATHIPWRGNFIALLREQYSVGSAAAIHHPLTIYDPFQPNWDSTWKEDVGADPRFRKQVEWELEKQDQATLVVVYLHGEDKGASSVSLLELGLCARSGRAVVGCDRGFWKRGNVQAVCQRYGVPLADSLDGLAERLVEKLKGLRA